MMLIGAVLAAISAVPSALPAAAFPGDTVDEIHWGYGENPSEVVLHWRGAETVVHLGTTTGYGRQETATAPAILPVDNAGPFREVRITGLLPDTVYHYKIGAAGLDHTLRTRPSSDFTWVDIGDTAATLCKPWVGALHTQIAGLAPDVVTHGGDISEANYCSAAGVHSYYTDQEAWSTGAADHPVWGNHEYGQPLIPPAAPGTPRDSLANYKGRHAVVHPQTVPNDTATKTGHPGCPPPAGGSGNGCRGEDWGWFDVSGVRFISIPEPWPGALADWQTKANTIMAAAQNDATIDFIVTYGHRPAYSSQITNAAWPETKSAIDALGDLYSPAARADGKYVLNVGHHVHGLEQFSPQHGVVHVGNGGGGQGLTTFENNTAPGSLWKLRHMGLLRGSYDATESRLTVQIICGPEFPNPRDACTQGTVLRTMVFDAEGDPPPPPPPPPPTTQWITNPSVEASLTGWSGSYGASPTIARVSGVAQDGTWSIQVTATSAAATGAGFNDNPRWVLSTMAGKAYTASAWVKAGAVGQRLVVQLREWNGSTLVNTVRGEWVATDTNWHQVSAVLTAAGSGRNLSMAVFAANLAAPASFHADSFSLTSPN
ncbi:MAG: hypothetical protein L0Y54_07755 [Sporichthyaceae bacterium]|nr:hypothetical protein [Sporichthyaceae bacterium]